MATVRCSFCQHANPVGAKYCNECGSTLRLKPCTHCDAVNDIQANSCHHCGRDFVDASVPAAVSSATPQSTDTPPASSITRALEKVVADLARLQGNAKLQDVARSSADDIEPVRSDSPIVTATPAIAKQPLSVEAPAIAIASAVATPVRAHEYGQHAVSPYLRDLLQRSRSAAVFVEEGNPARRLKLALAISALVIGCGTAFYAYRQTVSVTATDVTARQSAAGITYSPEAGPSRPDPPIKPIVVGTGVGGQHGVAPPGEVGAIAAQAGNVIADATEPLQDRAVDSGAETRTIDESRLAMPNANAPRREGAPIAGGATTGPEESIRGTASGPPTPRAAGATTYRPAARSTRRALAPPEARTGLDASGNDVASPSAQGHSYRAPAGPCTDAVAALALCASDDAFGRR